MVKYVNPVSYVAWICALLLLSLADLIITLWMLGHGAAEGNPVAIALMPGLGLLALLLLKVVMVFILAAALSIVSRHVLLPVLRVLTVFYVLVVGWSLGRILFEGLRELGG